MPIVLCKIHNDRPQGASLLCRHLAEQVRLRKAAGPATFVDLDGFMMKGGLCGECLGLLNREGLAGYLERRKHAPATPPAEDGDSERLEVLFSELVEPICHRCFEESSPDRTEA